jgi:ABC-type uncharacterized transport system permease subunit
MLNYTTVPLIVVICYVAITAIKSTKMDSRWYPLISCGIGILASTAMYFVLPDFLGATSLMVAVVSGAVSGLAATGSNQVLKQLMKSAEEGTLTVNSSKSADESTDDK